MTELVGFTEKGSNTAITNIMRVFFFNVNLNTEENL